MLRVLLLLCLCTDGTAFLLRRPTIRSQKNPLVVPAATRKTSKSKLWSTTHKSSSSVSSLEGSEIPKASPKTVDTLQRLLIRQEEELEETRRLLKIYQSTEMDGDLENDPKAKSIVESFMTGFDYGFVSRSEGALAATQNPDFGNYGPPGNVWKIGSEQLMRNMNAMRDEYGDETSDVLTTTQEKYRKKLERLTLNTKAIWEREEKEATIQTAPWVIKAPYLVLCFFLDVVFEGRNVPSRFFMLETVARIPYFSYISMLHMYETLGFWRRSSDVKRIHFAEELNEFNHLLIMESLGGDQQWWVRVLAQHSAIAYYIGLCLLWLAAPSLSYRFSEMLETHAVNTYSQLLDENEELLKDLPPPMAAIQYYVLGASDPFYAEFQTNDSVRKPGFEMGNLYDVFSAIRDDEGDHVSAMEKCLDPDIVKLSPSLERKFLSGAITTAAVAYFVAVGDSPFDIDSLDELAGLDIPLDEVIAGAAGLVGLGKEALSDQNEIEEIVGAAAAAEELGLSSFVSIALKWLAALL